MNEPTPSFVLWSQLHGQFLSRKPTRAMLIDDCRVLENCSLKGQPNPKTVKEYRTVLYNRRYVIDYLIKKVVEPLYPMPWNAYQQLLSEAYKEHKQNAEKS